MCGIIGAAGDLLPIHEKVVRTLLILDSLRGEDSTGIATVGKYKDAEVVVAKQLGNPFQLFDHRSYDDAMRTASRAIIGHNRYATVGGVSRATAHPFENDQLVGVHNGTLDNKYDLHDGYKYKVDSEALYHHIEFKGLDDAIQVAEGAWSLVWWDKYEETLNFLRNEKRPMHFASTIDKDGKPDGKCIFWASEGWMLDQALWRHNIACGEIIQIQSDHHVSIPISTGGVLGKATVRKMPEKKPKVYPRQPLANNTVNPLGVGVSNVVELVKKDGPISGTAYDRGYLRAKDVSFEIIAERVEGPDMDYLELSDPNHPYKEIRLYPEKDSDLWDHLGEWVIGDIQACSDSKTTPGKVYYMVNPKTVLLHTVEAQARFSASSATVNEVVFNAMGLTCDWCASPLVFGEENKFTLDKQCFCESCASQSDVKEVVNLC